jgi:hypothetical protein
MNINVGVQKMAFRDRNQKKQGSFRYQPRTAEDLKKRASQDGSNRDSMFNQDVKMYKPKEGDNNIRILPPTWPDAKHFGFDGYVHYDIGPDGAAYLCLEKMEGSFFFCSSVSPFLCLSTSPTVHGILISSLSF